jgi:glutamine amidotransferase
MKVGVIDYGVGNLGSVMQALEELRVTPVLLGNAINMHNADAFILPGVGNFKDCKDLLDFGGWTKALFDEILGSEKPLLGICLGMQLLADTSDEGAEDGNGTQGLGFIPGVVKHLGALGCTLRVPHVGWNGIKCIQADDLLLAGIPSGTDFYFVHSYAFSALDLADVVATAEYGIPVASVVRRGRVWGTQFHPEKSSRAGIRLLKNFVESASC